MQIRTANQCAYAHAEDRCSEKLPDRCCMYMDETGRGMVWEMVHRWLVKDEPLRQTPL